MTDLETYYKRLTPISPENLCTFSALFTPRTLKQGDYFISAGQIEKEVAFLESGIARSFYRTDEAIEYNKHFFVNPCFISGYASLITKTPSQINLQTLTDCNVHVAKYADVHALFQTCHDIESAARIIAELLFVQKEQKEIEIVLLDADKRYQIFQKKFPQLEQLIPQYHIASYLGITATQLSRIRRRRLLGK